VNDDPRPAPDVTQRLLETVDGLARELDPARGVQAMPQSAIERDLGIDSLGRVELLLRIESVFGVRLSDDTLTNAETVADLIAALQAARPPPPPPPHDSQATRGSPVWR
jgi:acyl carrier protein